MEKFRKFADPKTGKHPFLIETQKQSIGMTVLGCVLLIPRLLIYLKFVLIVFIKNSLIGSTNVASIMIDSVLYSVLLKVLGVSVTIKNKEELTKLGSTFIYLSNFSSHLDPLLTKST